MSLLSLVRDYARVYWQYMQPRHVQPAPLSSLLRRSAVMPTPEEFSSWLWMSGLYCSKDMAADVFRSRLSAAIRRAL